MCDPTRELIFQNEVIAQMLAGGWKRGEAAAFAKLVFDLIKMAS